MKNRKAIYSVLSFAAVIVPIALDSALRRVRVYYARDPKAVLLSALFSIAILSPVITSILLFAKISLQREVPVRFSRIVNLAATVAFAIGAAVFYRVFSILSFVSASPAMALILCLQLCSLAYDLFRSEKLD